MKHHIHSIVMLQAVSLLTSCAFLPISSPKDLQVVSMEAVRLDRDEISRNMLFTAIFNLSERSKCRIFKAFKCSSDSTSGEKDYICVTLETRCDLIELTTKHELNLGCHGRFFGSYTAANSYFPLIGSVFDGDTCIHLGNESIKERLIPLTNRDTHSPFRYQIYLKVRGEYTAGDINSGEIRFYDLRRDPKPMEIFLAGVDMLARPFESNHIIIPADSISECLKQ